MRIIDIQGIGPTYADKLAKVGIRTTEALLQEGATPDGRKKISESAGISPDVILKWVNMADLYRIKGIGSQYSELLEAAGVDTVVELSKRVAEHLNGKMLEINQAKNLINGMPGVKRIQRWIEQAKRLPRVVTY
jgi:predicted flap endonuclease-1-like 5' DNA nuclease